MATRFQERVYENGFHRPEVEPEVEREAIFPSPTTELRLGHLNNTFLQNKHLSSTEKSTSVNRNLPTGSRSNCFSNDPPNVEYDVISAPSFQHIRMTRPDSRSSVKSTVSAGREVPMTESMMKRVSWRRRPWLADSSSTCNEWGRSMDSSCYQSSTYRRPPARIRINVSGHHFEASSSLLDRHPDTLLGNPFRRREFYDRSRDELFIDRHRPSFEAIFNYYQSGGKLKRPHNVPEDIFLAELLFYELERDVVDEYKMSEGYVKEERVLPKNEIMRAIWTHFEYPDTSNSAYVIAIISVLMTLVSIVLFCVETLPRLRDDSLRRRGCPEFPRPLLRHRNGLHSLVYYGGLPPVLRLPEQAGLLEGLQKHC